MPTDYAIRQWQEIANAWVAMEIDSGIKNPISFERAVELLDSSGLKENRMLKVGYKDPDYDKIYSTVNVVSSALEMMDVCRLARWKDFYHWEDKITWVEALASVLGKDEGRLERKVAPVKEADKAEKDRILRDAARSSYRTEKRRPSEGW